MEDRFREPTEPWRPRMWWTQIITSICLLWHVMADARTWSLLHQRDRISMCISESISNRPLRRESTTNQALCRPREVLIADRAEQEPGETALLDKNLLKSVFFFARTSYVLHQPRLAQQLQGNSLDLGQFDLGHFDLRQSAIIRLRPEKTLWTFGST